MNENLLTIFESKIKPELKGKMLKSSDLLSLIIGDDNDIDTPRSILDELIELDALLFVKGIECVFIYLPTDKLIFAQAIDAINEAVKVSEAGNYGFFNMIDINYSIKSIIGSR